MCEGSTKTEPFADEGELFTYANEVFRFHGEREITMEEALDVFNSWKG